MIHGIPTELLSIVGIAVIGHIGGTVIAEMGGKTISVAWNLICYMAATAIGLTYVWKKIGDVMSVMGSMW